jgi:hypothetical protein
VGFRDLDRDRGSDHRRGIEPTGDLGKLVVGPADERKVGRGDE